KQGARQNLTMFEDYIRDAYRFFEQGQGAVNDDEAIARSYYRASIFCAASAVESFVNFIADTFEKGRSMPNHELAYLSDKTFYFDPKKGLLIEKTEFHRLEDKLKFLLTKFSPSFDFNNAAWSQLIAFKRLRDNLIHLRQLEDQTSVA